MKNELSIVEIQSEVSKQLATPEVVQALLETTFKGLPPDVMQKAIVEGMIRGFDFKDFLQRNVYALPFKDGPSGRIGYSLVTSIDNSRKIGMRSGIVGVDAPVFEGEVEGKPVTCSVTVRRKVGNDIGSFTATVYFSEYYKAGYNGRKTLWDTKPRTMIAKVAEMHALRKACPEELSQQYVEEEIEVKTLAGEMSKALDLEPYKAKLAAVKSMEELQDVWATLPAEIRFIKEVELLKQDLKMKYENS